MRKKSLPCLTSVNLENNPSCAVSVPQSADIPFHLVDVYLVPDKIAFSPEKISLSFRFKMQIHGKQRTVFVYSKQLFWNKKGRLVSLQLDKKLSSEFSSPTVFCFISTLLCKSFSTQHIGIASYFTAWNIKNNHCLDEQPE